jgi:hypothetical protein
LSPDELTERLSGPGRAALIVQAAEAGIAEAEAVYGQMLLDGTEVARDERAAFGWFMRAAAQDHLMALNMVGRCYDLGQGVAVDKVRAAACFRVAAERGLVEAMYNHATLLALGEGVPQDKAAALAWLERAAAQGYAKAVNFVGSFREDGWACPRDLDAAAECYARAAAGGDFRGMFNHARMLAAAGDLDGAVMWLERAGAAGNAPFVAKAAEWLARSDAPRLRTDGLAALRRGAGC